MNEMKVARGLGWFSIGLGLAEVVAGRQLGRALGMKNRVGLIRVFGLREIGQGAAILALENKRYGLWSRVIGDVADLAVLASAFTRDNPKRDNVALAIGSVAGVAAVDFWCAKRLHSARPHGSMHTHRQFVADYPSRRTASGSFPPASP
ncbi:hypothetical protein BH23PLA1_BH23PLA1_34600 [soil metagenome]